MFVCFRSESGRDLMKGRRAERFLLFSMLIIPSIFRFVLALLLNVNIKFDKRTNRREFFYIYIYIIKCFNSSESSIVVKEQSKIWLRK